MTAVTYKLCMPILGAAHGAAGWSALRSERPQPFTDARDGV